LSLSKCPIYAGLYGFPVSASSGFPTTTPSNSISLGKINSEHAWTPATSTRDEYYQYDFLRTVSVVMLFTQEGSEGGSVLSFKLLSSEDGERWEEVEGGREY
jgi:F5/8 type C domain